MVETNGGGLAWLDGRRLASHWKGVYLSLFLCLTLWGGAHPAVFMIENGMPPLTVFLKFLCFPAITALPLSLSVTVLSFLVGLPLDIKRMNRIRMMALLTLGRWRDPRHLGLILREYVGQKGRMHRAAEVALREVLPLLEACETAESTRDFVPNLCKALQRKERQVLDYTPQEEALEMLLLEALGKVGDGRALPAVERIAQRGRTLALQGLAQNILPVLQSRARLVNDPVQLLRGVARPDPAPATLLRPARNEDLTPPDQLLRLPGAVEPTHRPITIQRPGS